MFELPNHKPALLAARLALVCALITAVTATSAHSEEAASEKTQVETNALADSDSDGLLEADTTAAAVSSANQLGERVEDISQRTETDTVVANPDGSFTATTHGAAVRVVKDNEWVPVDYDLVKGEDGSYGPKASSTDVSIGAGGTRVAARVTFSDTDWLAVTWPTALPKPSVSGGVATYKVSPTTDLVVAVTAEGVNTHIKLNAPPTSDDPVFRLGFQTQGVDVDQSSDGNLEVTGDGDRVIASTSALVAWDAHLDRAGDPARIVDLEANLQDGQQSGQTQAHTLELSAPNGYFQDENIKYPVTIDPDVSLSQTRDTWVRSGDPSRGAENRLIVGKVDPATSSNANPARSYLKLYAGQVENKPDIVVTSAELGLYQYYGYSCTNRQMNVHGVTGNWSDSVTWPDRPALSGSPAVVFSNRGASGCAADWTKVDVTGIAQRWAAGTLDMQGVRLAAEDEGASSSERRFCSMNPTSGTACGTAAKTPYLRVTYNTYPVSATAPTFSAGSSGASVSSVVSDPDGGNVRANFVVTDQQGMAVSNFYSAFVPSGGTASAAVAGIPTGDYTVRAYANDGLLNSKAISPSTQFSYDAPRTAPPAPGAPTATVNYSSVTVTAPTTYVADTTDQLRVRVTQGQNLVYEGYSTFIAAGDNGSLKLPLLPDGTYSVQVSTFDGYLYSTSASSASFVVSTGSASGDPRRHSITPVPVTESAPGQPVDTSAIAPGESRNYQITGLNGVSANSYAVGLSVTATAWGTAGRLELSKTGEAIRGAGNALNLPTPAPAGTTSSISGNFITEINSDGQFTIKNTTASPASVGSINVTAWYDDPSPATSDAPQMPDPQSNEGACLTKADDLEIEQWSCNGGALYSTSTTGQTDFVEQVVPDPDPATEVSDGTVSAAGSGFDTLCENQPVCINQQDDYRGWAKGNWTYGTQDDRGFHPVGSFDAVLQMRLNGSQAQFRAEFDWDSGPAIKFSETEARQLKNSSKSEVWWGWVDGPVGNGIFEISSADENDKGPWLYADRRRDNYQYVSNLRGKYTTKKTKTRGFTPLYGNTFTCYGASGCLMDARMR